MAGVAPDRSRVVCVVLASGRGVRMGGPKALLWWDASQSVTLAQAHVLARSRECGRVVVVTRHDIGRRLRELCALEVIVSDEPDEHGPAGSIAAACRAGALDAAGLAVLTPVDVPPVGSETVERLLGAIDGDVQAARPRFGTRRGHPVAVRSACLCEVYAGQARPPLRDVLRSLADRCVDVTVDDPDVLADLDTMDAFEARTGRPPRFA